MTPDDRPTRRDPGLAGSAIALLSREVTRMPIVALSVGLQAWERTRSVRELALRRGSEVLQIAAHTPIGRFLPQPPVTAEVADEAERIAADARDTTQIAAASVPTTDVSPPAAKPTKPAEPSPEAVAAGAPGAVTAAVEKVTEHLHLDEPATRDDLPIPDFDNVSLGSLRARLRSLSLEQLVTLREWEQGHANRLAVVTLLDNRIAKVSAAPPTSS